MAVFIRRNDVKLPVFYDFYSTKNINFVKFSQEHIIYQQAPILLGCFNFSLGLNQKLEYLSLSLLTHHFPFLSNAYV